MKFFAVIDEELWYFPYGGGGVGLLVTRAAPIAHPRWRITTFYGASYTAVPVEDDDIRLRLLKLPRCKHE